MIKRQPFLRAFPGYHAFPGGKIEPEDMNAESHCYGLEASEAGALERELEEELGYSLAKDWDEGRVLSLHDLGVACPPVPNPRFAVRYIKIELNYQPEFTLAPEEIASGQWQPPIDFFQSYLKGEILLVEPAMNTVRALSDDISATDVNPFNIVCPNGALLRFTILYGMTLIPVPSNTLPPATDTNCLLLGDDGASGILVDPSPNTDEAYQALLSTLSLCRSVDALLISHHHPDHHERAPQLARRLAVPILCSAITLRHLHERFGQYYLQGVEIKIVNQNDVITRWLGQNVICQSLPGHDDGMIGLSSADNHWFYVSDLIEAGSSVVIPEPEGDMTAYFHSLQRVIDTQAEVIIPAHGLPFGGVACLQQTLDHRLERERQIMACLQAGLDKTAMLERLYPELPEKLVPYAMHNIRQHIRKIESSIDSNSTL